MAKRNSKKNVAAVEGAADKAAVVVERDANNNPVIAAVKTTKPVEPSDVFDLVTKETPVVATKTDDAGQTVVLANPALGLTADVPSVWVDPKTVFVDFDSRTIPNPNQHATDIAYALSIYLYGQKQPAIGYYDDIDNRLVLTTGRTRRRAVILLNEGFEAVDPRNGETVQFKDENRKLWVAIEKQKSKEDQFVGDLQTQINNTDLTPVQEAYAVKHLTEKFGWSLTDAAGLFGKNNTNRASKLLKLLTLEQEVIEAVHNNKLSVDAAIGTAELTPTNRLAIIAKATDDETGEVNGGLIKELLRDVYSQSDEKVREATGRPKAEGDGEEKEGKAKKGGKDEGDGPKGVSLAKNRSHFTAFADSILNDEESDAGEPTKELLKAIKRWFTGVKFGDTALKSAFAKYTKAKLPPTA